MAAERRWDPMAARYELKPSGNQFHWTLLGGNNEKILSSERYTTKGSAIGGISSCRQNSPHDERYSRLTSIRHEPYFVLKAANGEVIGTSEMYSSVSAREAGIASCKKNGPGAPVDDQT